MYGILSIMLKLQGLCPKPYSITKAEIKDETSKMNIIIKKKLFFFFIISSEIDLVITKPDITKNTSTPSTDIENESLTVTSKNP